MSSRAAGGRRRQLKPLQEPQSTKRTTDEATSKFSKGFFSRSKSKAPPSPASSNPTSAYPSPPSTGPTPLPPSPNPAGVHILQERDSARVGLLSTEPPHSAIWSRTFIHQQHYDGAMTRTPTVQSNFSSSGETFMRSSSGDARFMSYTGPSRSQSYTPQSLTPGTTTAGTTYTQRNQPINEDSRYPNFSLPQFRTDPLRPLPVPRSAPFSPDAIPTGFDFPYPPTSSPPQDSLLLQPTRRGSNSPTPSELLYRSDPRPHTPPGGLSVRGKAASDARGRSPHDFLRSDLGGNYESNISDVASSVYPSPPSSNPRLTPSPLRWNDSSSVVSDGESGTGYQSFSSASTSSSTSSVIQEVPRRLDVAESITSSSSGSSQQSGDPDTPMAAKPPPSSFHFPGSRSTGRPKVSSKTGTPQKIKIRSRNKHSGDEDSNHLSTPVTPITDLSSPEISPSYDRNEARLPNTQFTAISSASQPRANSATAMSSASTLSASTSSSSTTSPSQAYIYPSSRSRAHPSRAPLIGKKKGGVTDQAPEGVKKSKFMGIGIRLKKKKRDSIGSLGEIQLTRPVGSDIPSSMYRSSDSITNAREGESSARDGKRRQEHHSGQCDHTSLPPSPSPSPSPSPAPLQHSRNEWSRKGKGKGKGKFVSYPLDPYDSLLLDNDRLTGELLRRLNPTNTPTFHNYGNMPPATILDLGCGQGHWVLDAAITWKGYGTHVTGYDMVDTMKALRPWAVSQGVADNIAFVKGNFLRERLPFPDESFDLVRMSCLTLCITADAWEYVLEEVARVLTLGGRLELVDDHLFFPYGKPSQANNDSLPSFHTIPQHAPDPVVSDTASIYSMLMIDAGAINPGLGLALSEESASGDLYDLYGHREEDETENVAGVDHGGDDEGDTATLNGFSQDVETSSFRATPRPQGVFQQDQHPLTATEWNHQQAISKDLEALFEHMLTQKYGLHLDSSSFILDMLKRVFRHAREMTKMHLTLVPSSLSNSASHSVSSSSQSCTLSAFSQSPGLMLWPSTLIAMSPTEIELHTSKHLRTLLSCKNSLVEHALEATEEEEIDEESVFEAVWEYENFLRPRFFPPPGAGANLPEALTPTPLEADLKHFHQPNLSSSRASIFSATSVSTENQDAMWEYQLDVRHHFGWSDSPNGQGSSGQGCSSRLGSAQAEAVGARSMARTPNKRDTIASSTSSVAPPYSLTEPTHVRTLRVYEAIKMDQFTLEATT